MKHALHWFVTVMILLSLSACSIPRSDRPAQKIYTIQARENPGATTKLPVHLVIRVNYTSPALNSNKIIIMPETNRYDHIANSSWPASLPFYLRDLLIHGFVGSNDFHSVGTAPASGMVNYVLDVQVYNFEARYTDKAAAPVCHLRMGAVVSRLDEAGASSDSVFLFSAQRQAGENSIHAIIAAFDSAYNQLSKELQTSVIKSISHTEQASP